MSFAAEPLQIIAAALFAVALIHTFSTRWFEHLAHTRPAHAGLWHLLGEVEVVFGFWAFVLVAIMFAWQGKVSALAYIDGRNFTEPMFVFAIMVVAGTRPVLQAARSLVYGLARLVPLSPSLVLYAMVLTVVPLLGSFVTEPAAMTLAALMLRDAVLSRGVSARLKYATLGVLFVNVSIGGTLTPYAAPPVLMVAGPWSWDLAYMFTHFGWKAATAVTINAVGAAWLFRRELSGLGRPPATAGERVPLAVQGVHLLFLAGVVVFAHHPPVFVGLLLFFLGFTAAYPRHQDALILREALLVAFFLAGLVVLGGLQEWWLKPLLLGMNSTAVFFGATALTAVTDNAALTYLGSLVPGLTEDFKYSLVAGAVVGGGLTVVANAPNPAGLAILRGQFEDGAVDAGRLLLAAALPTVVAMAAFWLL